MLFMHRALKESGYESDSTLVFRRRDDTAQQLSPLEQKEAYKVIQKGGDVPLHGLRRAAPERPKGQSHQLLIIYKCAFLCCASKNIKNSF